MLKLLLRQEIRGVLAPYLAPGEMSPPSGDQFSVYFGTPQLLGCPTSQLLPIPSLSALLSPFPGASKTLPPSAAVPEG